MFEDRTHLERLVSWRAGNVLRLDPAEQDRAWMSPLLPTRRFGPPAWVSFQMRAVPGTETTGDFLGWIVFSHESLRLLGYFARPFADTFGVVAPFKRPESLPPKGFVPAMGRLGAAFLDEGDADDADSATLREFMSEQSEEYRRALDRSATDFFKWLDVARVDRAVDG